MTVISLKEEGLRQIVEGALQHVGESLTATGVKAVVEALVLAEPDDPPPPPETEAPFEGQMKPCPFCGCGARLERKTGRAGTACPSGWLREKVICKNRKCEAQGATFKRPGLAVAAWNTRSIQPSHPQGEPS